MGALIFPYIKTTTDTEGILSTKTGVGFCIGYDSSAPSKYCCVSFGLNRGNNIRVDKLSGTLEIGSYNNWGTFDIEGADTYFVLSL